MGGDGKGKGKGKGDGKGDGKGKGKESNEEAMFRMMGGKDTGKGKDLGGKGKDLGGKGKDLGGKGGKGKKGKSGKGGKGDGPPDLDSIPEGRRKALSDQLEAFAASAEQQLAMPPSLTGLERKFVHSRAEELGLTSQSFGQGKDRYISVFRPEGGAAAEGGAERSGGADGAAGEDEEAGLGPVQYSALVLDEESQERLRKFCEKQFKGGFGDWTPHCEHMTICMGPLTEPMTEDNRSVADLIRKQTAALSVRQVLDLKVVSTGYSHEAMAVGVVGCTSCNKNPHITVATASGAQPRQSNDIKKWEMLEPEKQISLHGIVWQRGEGRPDLPAPWLWRRSAEASVGSPTLAEVALEGAVRVARAVLCAERGGRPKSEKALRTVLDRRAIPRSLWAVHPAKLAEALGSALPKCAGVQRRLEAGLRRPAHDPLDLFRTPRPVPEAVERRARSALASLPSKDTLPVSQLALWLISQASCSSELNVDAVLKGLAEAGAVRLGENGSVEYLALGDETKADALSHLPYARPWPLEKEPRKKSEKKEAEESSSDEEESSEYD